MFENLNFGKIGFKKSVFEKHFISYSCILLIKYFALRSLCIKLLCFSKNWFFQNFHRSNLFLDRSKLRLKFLDWFCVFRSIEPMFWSIENCIESFLLKPFVPHVFFTIQTFQKHVLSLFDRSKTPSKIFVVFPQNFCKVFLL